jgi:1-acyl-sn-glycerol-3-phosphate acyltransferase
MFLEGGIVRDRPLRTLKTGLASLVLQAEAMTWESLTVPIVPMALPYDPEAAQGAKILINISPSFYPQDYRQESDKHTALVLTQALETALLQGLKTI